MSPQAHELPPGMPRRRESLDEEDGREALKGEALLKTDGMTPPKEKRASAFRAAEYLGTNVRALRARGSHQRPLANSYATWLADATGHPEWAPDVLEALNAAVREKRRTDGMDKRPVLRTDVEGGTTGEVRLDAAISEGYGPPSNFWRRGKAP